jgi:hypothetical protein
VYVAGTQRCGKPAAWSDGSFAECVEHMAQPISLSRGTKFGTIHVGAAYSIPRSGKTYAGTVSKIGTRGAIYVTFTYDNGAERTVRV